MKTSIVVLIGFVAICFAISAVGALFRPGEWYQHLAKPPWRPPNWIFPPVWTMLYLTIAVAGWLTWRKVGFSTSVVTWALFLIQLLLNAAWTPLFFGLHRPDLAFFDIVLLWLSILGMISVFSSISMGAALLLLPYFLWVTFAAALNFSIWRLNSITG